jgi:TolB-like protein/tetratricopeptide (TPR) repeat protein
MKARTAAQTHSLAERGLFAELKRRNVFRVAGVYLATSWLIVHVGTVFGETLETPHWVMRFVMLVLALGFPGAIGFAWAFEVTQQGVRRTGRVPRRDASSQAFGRKLDFAIIGVLALVLLIVVLDGYVFDETAAPGGKQAGGVRASIAVLPFVDLSQAKDSEYLSDGLAEELLNRLAQDRRFKVTGRTSSFAFKGKSDDLRVIGAKLGVDNILEGSVRRQGDHIRVTAQLITATDGAHAWSQTYDRHMSDVFDIQDEIARAVVSQLERALLVDEDAPTRAVDAVKPTSNIDAYTSYLRGQYLLRDRIGAQMEGALSAYERAAKLDPQFALAHVGVAKALTLLTDRGYRSMPEVQERIEAALARALELQPDLAEAHAAKGLFLDQLPLRRKEAYAALNRAAELNPNDPMVLHWLAGTMLETGRPATEFLPLRERAYVLDPVAPNVVWTLAFELYGAGKRLRAQSMAEELAAVSPSAAFDLRSGFAWMDGRHDESVRWAAKAISVQPEAVERLVNLGFTYEKLGDAGAAERAYKRALAAAPRSPFAAASLGALWMYAGRRDNAKTLLADAATGRANDRDLLRAYAWYASEPRELKGVLQKLREAEPTLFQNPPEIAHPMPYYAAPTAVWITRKTGDAATADRIAAATRAFTDTWARPTQKGDPDWTLMRLAAAVDDRTEVVQRLQALYDSGSALPASTLHEPLFAPYLQDAEVAALLKLHAARRESWRKALAAEGL